MENLNRIFSALSEIEVSHSGKEMIHNWTEAYQVWQDLYDNFLDVTPGFYLVPNFGLFTGELYLKLTELFITLKNKISMYNIILVYKSKLYALITAIDITTKKYLLINK